MKANMQAVPDMYENTVRTEPGMGDPDMVRREQATGQVTSLGARYAEMRKSIRAYGLWMLLSAALTLLLAFDIGWAAVLLLVGLMSFYFYDAAGILLVYVAVLLWAALSNLLSFAQTGWGFLGVVQIVWAVLAYRAYRKYHHTKAEYEADEASHAISPVPFNNRESLMVWLAPVFGAIGMVGLCGVFPLSIVYYAANSQEPAQAVYTALAAILEVGMLGIPLGIAAMQSGYSPRAAAIAGIVLGTLSALLMILGFILTAVAAA